MPATSASHIFPLSPRSFPYYTDHERRNRYLILDVLGQGTFGQVVKCQNLKTQEVVAVKVIKNKTAYFNQSMMEVSVLDLVRYYYYPLFIFIFYFYIYTDVPHSSIASTTRTTTTICSD